MHLQQTKRASARTGGPQYYFHSLPGYVLSYLRQEGAVRVALVTPYGATKSDFFAVGKDHKLDWEKERITIQAGNVGHDRIQAGRAGKSIGEAIRSWFKLPAGQFERIDLDIEIIDDCFYLTPTKVKYAGSPRSKDLAVSHRPLSFERNHISKLWKDQIERLGRVTEDVMEWSFREITRIVRDHFPRASVPFIKEEDLLRASGPLERLGVRLGPYVGKGFDCAASTFQFLDLEPYTVPVEVKKRSAGFHYQEGKYGRDELSRAVILCMVHNKSHLADNIDVIELAAFPDYAETRLGLRF